MLHCGPYPIKKSFSIFLYINQMIYSNQYTITNPIQFKRSYLKNKDI